MKWVADWPVMGTDPDGDGTGEPVLTYKKPDVGKSYAVETPPDSDEFGGNGLGLQWQWHANPQPNWMFTSGSMGLIRLFNIPLPEDFKNFWDVPNLLLQKFPAPAFTATTKVTFIARTDGERTGLIVMGLDYAYISVTKRADGLYVSQTVCKDAEHHAKEQESATTPLKSNTFYLRVSVGEGAVCTFSYSTDGRSFTPLGQPFTAREGKWIGAKLGIFAVRTGSTRENGNADFDWFRIE
jgi:beta-xylosidase